MPSTGTDVALDVGLCERREDRLTRQLDEATYRIGELTMEIEVLRRQRQGRRDFHGRQFFDAGANDYSQDLTMPAWPAKPNYFCTQL